MAQKVFISRRLSPDSIFHELSSRGYEIHAESLIQIEYVAFETPPDYDAVFFYSQKAIGHFFETVPYEDDGLYGVMGKSSNRVFKDITGRDADIIGNGDNQQLASTMNAEWPGLNVLFPQAKESMRSLEPLLKDIIVSNLIIYDNSIKSGVSLPDCDCLLFTSPMNVQAYLNQYSLEGKMVIAIGHATAKYIQDKTGISVEYCEKPSMSNLYQLFLYKILLSHDED